ncbi:hypothetical protein M501DRAFT_1015489 [Patellaria atrata CBS 101060]|uniref:Capsule polysaccharide biosynthesis protein n=1 Tax=Patellaria atrata CBS 101060 TaxID=1346257 RepID=A0A9P4SCZ2_9PEZI|nr:hypothetical protein M501DRAFT_1015489 [Patellaria atrata CBS 101060]
MSVIQRGPILASISGFGASLLALTSSPRFRDSISRFLGVSKSERIWRMLALLFAILNFKNLPFVWHFRILRSFLYHLYLQPTPLPPRGLFTPIITTTRAPLLETDYNLHKSNSTYFSDADVSRSHLMTALLRPGIKKSGLTHNIILGGVTASFRKEIAPYRPYELWTRVLTWDRKWIYTVTFFVAPSPPAAKTPSVMQPWRSTQVSAAEDGSVEAGKKDPDPPTVFATTVAKYVVKRGRLTIPPEQVWRDCGLLPPVPDSPAMPAPSDPSTDPDPDVWTWETMEAERLRGLKFAEAWSQLDGLEGEFAPGKGQEEVMGEFADLLF